MNIIICTVVTQHPDYGLLTVKLKGPTGLQLNHPAHPLGHALRCNVYADHITLSRRPTFDSSQLNQLPCN